MEQIAYTTMRLSQVNYDHLKDLMHEERLDSVDEALSYLIENRPSGHEAEDLDLKELHDRIHAIDGKVDMIMDLVEQLPKKAAPKKK